jgi:outer membrane protein OmpA-like peptidoglycan-associated protein
MSPAMSPALRWCSLPLALAAIGCAAVPRPSELDDASTALNAPETRDLAALRPTMLAAAKEHLARAEQAFARGDAALARSHAELALQRIRAAENFVARDAATEQAKIMAARLLDLGRDLDRERDDLARLQALNDRLDKLAAAPEGPGGTPSPALEGARKALIAARGRQAEAVGAGARSLARDTYEQGVTLLEGSASALEMKLAEESATASAAAVTAFAAAVREAAAAKTGAAKADSETTPGAAARSAAATSSPAGATGATAARKEEGRSQSAAVGASGASRAAAGATDPGTGPGAEARRVTDATPRIGIGKSARIRELIHAAEDARADALGRGAASSAAVVQGTYLLQLAREALADGDEPRATDKAREARQAFGSASAAGPLAAPGAGLAPAVRPPAPVAPPAPAPAAKPLAVESPSAQDATEREAAVKALVAAQQGLADVVGRGHPESAVKKARSLIQSAEGWLDRKAFGRARTFAEDAQKELKLVATEPLPKPEPAVEKPAAKAPPQDPVKPEPPAAKEPVTKEPPPKPVPPPAAEPAVSSETARRRSAESFAEETIRTYRRAPAEPPPPAGWEGPYRKVIQALALRDKTSAAALTPAAKAAVTIGAEKIAEARAAWARDDFRAAGALAEAAVVELSKISPPPASRPLPLPAAPPSPGEAKDPSTKTSPAAAPGTAAPGSESEAYRKAESAVREASVLVEVCEAEKCAERSLELSAAGKAAVTSARTAFTEKRYDYAVELAEGAKKKLSKALETPKPSAAAPAADTAALKKQRTDADDAVRDAGVQRELCEQKKCTGKDLEPWLRAESHLAAARAAYADGDFERAKSKAAEASRLLKAQLDAQAAAAAAAPPPVAPKPVPKIVLPSDVTSVEVRGNQLLVTPSFQFTSGSAVLTPASRPSLAVLAKVLLHNKKRIRSVSIIGYTDNKGIAATNTAISERRAKAVADGLVAAGVAQSIVTSAGRGPDNPIADNATAEGRTTNRRVEVRVELTDEGS